MDSREEGVAYVAVCTTGISGIPVTHILGWGVGGRPWRLTTTVCNL